MEEEFSFKPRKPKRNFAISNFLALIISGISLLVSVSSLAIDTITKFIFSRPQINMVENDNNLAIENSGTGPAIIRSLYFYFDNVCTSGDSSAAREAMFYDQFTKAYNNEVIKNLNERKIAIPNGLQIRVNTEFSSDNQYLLSDHRRNILQLEDPPRAELKNIFREAFQKTVNRADVYMYYCSPGGIYCMHSFPPGRKTCDEVDKFRKT